jgi:hypothetical protein
MAGYIKLYRDIQFNKIWQEKPYTRGQAWVDMLLRCNHICVQMPPQYQSIWVLRGQFLLSNLKLAEAWGWDEKKVRRLMEYLVKEKMIRYLPRNKFCVYEITKYAELQALDTELFQAAHAEQKPSKRRTKAEQKPTNNNDNNDNNDKKILYSSEHVRMAEKLKAYILENNPNAKTPDDLSNWATDLERMMRIDKRTEQQIFAVMEFSQRDQFWKSNILSAGKFREKFDTLLLQKDRPMQNHSGKQAPQAGNFQQRPIADDLDNFYKDVCKEG